MNLQSIAPCRFIRSRDSGRRRAARCSAAVYGINPTMGLTPQRRRLPLPPRLQMGTRKRRRRAESINGRPAGRFPPSARSLALWELVEKQKIFPVSLFSFGSLDAALAIRGGRFCLSHRAEGKHITFAKWPRCSDYVLRPPLLRACPPLMPLPISPPPPPLPQVMLLLMMVAIVVNQLARFARLREQSWPSVGQTGPPNSAGRRQWQVLRRRWRRCCCGLPMDLECKSTCCIRRQMPASERGGRGERRAPRTEKRQERQRQRRGLKESHQVLLMARIRRTQLQLAGAARRTKSSPKSNCMQNTTQAERRAQAHSSLVS